MPAIKGSAGDWIHRWRSRVTDRLANLDGLIDRLFCHFLRAEPSAAICQNQSGTSGNRQGQSLANGFMISTGATPFVCRVCPCAHLLCGPRDMCQKCWSNTVSRRLSRKASDFGNGLTKYSPSSLKISSEIIEQEFNAHAEYRYLLSSS